MTTPAANNPNLAAAWTGMAEELKSEGRVELAGRAYAAAFAAEPTNAQLLWDHAVMVEQRGDSAQARTLYRKLADGKWQPRFEGLRSQAQAALRRTK